MQRTTVKIDPTAASDPAVASAPGATGRIPHLRPLDGLRGVAVLAVVFYHFSPDVLPGGFMGVDVFFVLSGFLITSLLVAERESTGGIRLRVFWVRRARRLLPALFLVLVAVGLYALLRATSAEAERLRNDGLAALGYFANWRFIASGQSYIEQFLGAAPSPLRHTWSLAIEEQFYLVWPLVVGGLGLLVIRRRRSEAGTAPLRRTLVVLCLVGAVVSVGLMAALFSPGANPSRVYYGTDTHASLLLVGAALGALTAGVLRSRDPRWRGPLVVLGSGAGIVLVVLFAAVHDTSTWLYEGGYGAVAVLVALVIAAAGQPGANPLARLLSIRPLVGLGLISYGVYLWHWPVFVWVTEARTGLDGLWLWLLRAAITVGVSVASYLVVEMPIRRGALRRIDPRLPWVVAPVGAVLAAAILIVPPLALDGSVVAAPPVSVPAVGAAEVSAAYEGAPRCDGDPEGSSPVTLPRGSNVTMYGNSPAGEIVPCLTSILEANGDELRALTQNGASLCDLLSLIEEDAASARMRPDIAVLFTAETTLTACMEGLEGDALYERYMHDARRAIDLWLEAGVGVVLVPPITRAGEAGPGRVQVEFDRLVSEYGDSVAVVDSGVYLRDVTGTYQWSMPCAAGGEPGCAADGTIGVRNVRDGGFHTCADPAWTGGACGEEFAAGQRRVSAAIAAHLLTRPA